MTPSVTPLKPQFGAKITGVDISTISDAAIFEEIQVLFETHSVLFFPNQPLNDDLQVAFSEHFGPLEQTIATNPMRGSPFARQSNIDIETGEKIPLDDPRMAYQKGNRLWHADSTFKDPPSLCSILSAREVPPTGGATEFISTAYAYYKLDIKLRNKLEGLIVEHDFVYSRRLTGFYMTEDQQQELPAAHHPLVRVNPFTGRKSLMIGAHAKKILGWPLQKGRELLDDLLRRATKEQHIYRHEWKAGNVVVWDNRSTLHRATEFDTDRYRRVMQRTTVSGISREKASTPFEPNLLLLARCFYCYALQGFYLRPTH